MTVVQGDAAITWAEDGSTFVAQLAEPLRNTAPQPRQAVDQFESEDGTTIRRITIGSEYRELVGTIRYHGDSALLESMLAAGMRGVDMVYYESTSDPSSAVPFVLMSHGPVAPDSQLWFQSRYEVSVVLRRLDGGRFGALTDRALFRYSAGSPLAGSTFTRSGVAPFVSVEGVVSSAASGIRRTTWIDGVPHDLFEPAIANLNTSDDLTAWSASGGSPVVTSGIDDPAGGTDAYTVADDSGSGIEFIERAVTFTGGTGLTRAAAFDIRERAPTTAAFLALYDATDTVYRGQVRITGYDGGRPEIQVIAGALLDVIPLGNGYWRVLIQGDGINSANVNRLRIIPAGTNVGEGGSLDVYRANAFDAEYPSLVALDASVSIAAETLDIPINFGPQAFTLYLDLLNLNQYKTQASFLGDILTIGRQTSGNGFVQIDNGGAGEDLRAASVGRLGSTAQIDFGAGSTFGYGSRLELVVQVDAAFGLTGSYAIDGGSEVGVGSATNTDGLPPSWAVDIIRVHQYAGGLRSVKLGPPAKGLSYMRAY